MLQNLIKLYVCFTCACAAYHGKLQKFPKKSPTLLPVAPEVKVKQHKRRLQRWKSRYCEEMPPFEETKKDRGVGDVEEGFEQVDSCLFFGEKRYESLLKVLEHVGKNA